MQLWIKFNVALFFVPSDFLLQAGRTDYFVEQVSEGEVQVFAVFRARLEVGDVVPLGELTSNLLVHLDIVDQVDFVAEHDFLREWVRIFANFLQPVLHVLKAALVSHVVDKNDPGGPFVIRVSQRPEFDLARGIPNRHFDL